jgi:hypothetical protein
MLLLISYYHAESGEKEPHVGAEEHNTNKRQSECVLKATYCYMISILDVLLISV